MHDDDDDDPLLPFILEICQRLKLAYGGFHTMGPGVLNGEKCPEIAFHVGALHQARTASGLRGTGLVYRALVAISQTLVFDDKGKEVARYADLTKASLE